ncbi:MAG: lysozyme [Alteromonadaceae bacterium]|nr:lysozyme [Alteromonadaceae bacterium]|tara:strand:+ start:191 stop:604 length:414 start_codon:yes stop_codon:yes gene_type:complete
MDHELLKSQLERHEGLRLHPYLDTVGKMTIGYGRNLDDNGISKAEAAMMLESDIQNVVADLEYMPTYKSLNPIRQTVICNMAYNMGIPTLMTFRKMWAAIGVEKWDVAAAEMMNSRWARQVGQRAAELATLMSRGRA